MASKFLEAITNTFQTPLPQANDLDKYLIVKALTTFKLIADKQEDIVIKTV